MPLQVRVLAPELPHELKLFLRLLKHKEHFPESILLENYVQDIRDLEGSAFRLPFLLRRNH